MDTSRSLGYRGSMKSDLEASVRHPASPSRVCQQLTLVQWYRRGRGCRLQAAGRTVIRVFADPARSQVLLVVFLNGLSVPDSCHRRLVFVEPLCISTMRTCVVKSFQALYPVYRSARRSQIGTLAAAKFSRPSRLEVGTT